NAWRFRNMQLPAPRRVLGAAISCLAILAGVSAFAQQPAPSQEPVSPAPPPPPAPANPAVPPPAAVATPAHYEERIRQLESTVSRLSDQLNKLAAGTAA